MEAISEQNPNLEIRKLHTVSSFLDPSLSSDSSFLDLFRVSTLIGESFPFCWDHLELFFPRKFVNFGC